MKHRPSLIRLLPVVGAACLLQACAVPQVSIREASVDLPAQFQDKTGQSAEEANINWSDWFADEQLAKLIDTAVANNQEAAILLQRITIAANEVSARQGEYLPSVSIGGELETEKVGSFTRAGAVEEGMDIREDEGFPEPLPNIHAGLHSAWELDVWRKLRNSAKVASLEYMASMEGRRLFMTELVAEVAKSYYELMALDMQLQNLDRMIAIQRNALETTRELQSFGRGSSLPVVRFEAEVSKNQSERYTIEQRIIEIENRLNLLLGRTPQPIPRNSDKLMELEPKPLETGIPTELLSNRPDIRRAELELEAAKLDIAVAKANFYPSFALRAGVGLEAFDEEYLLDTPDSLMYSLSADVVAPLINRKAIAARYKNASAAQVQAAFEYERTVITAYSEVVTRLAELDNLAGNLARKNRQVSALNESVELATQLFASARGEYLEVLLAQRDALEARSELIEIRQKQMSAMVALYRALGGGWQPGGVH